MRNTVNIFVLLLTVVIIQSCGTKTNEQQAEASQSTEESTISLNEKHAQIEAKQAALREEKRNSYQALIIETPFYTNEAGIIVYNKAEVAPTYVGGNEAMKKYLANNLVYPLCQEPLKPPL